MPNYIHKAYRYKIPKSQRVVRRRRPHFKHSLKLNKEPSVFSFVRTCDLTLNSTWKSLVSTGCGTALTADGLYIESIVTGGNLYASYSLDITLGSLPDVNEFLTLFDSYKIDKCTFTLTPFTTGTVQSDSTGGGTSYNQPLGVMVGSALDFDDSTPFAASTTGWNQMREYKSYRMVNGFKGARALRRSFTPKPAMSLFLAGSAFTSYAQAPRVWIDCNNNATHYGIKFMIQLFSPTTAQNTFTWFKPELRMHFRTKDLR